MINDGLRLLSFYSAGVLAYALRDRLRPSHLLAGAAAVFVLVAGFSSETLLYTLTPVPLTYLLLHIGATWRTRIAAEEDVSFGLYIYGYPVQQVLGMAGLGTLLPVWGFALVSLALTFPLARFSWRFIEKPAMQLRLTRPRLPEDMRNPAPTAGVGPERDWHEHTPAPMLVSR